MSVGSESVVPCRQQSFIMVLEIISNEKCDYLFLFSLKKKKENQR